MSEIPMDLLFGEIVSLLPVQDLLRYRCVCKVWRHTIDHPSFIENHLHRRQMMIKNSSNATAAIAQLIVKGNHLSRFYSLSLQSSDVDDDENKIKIVEANYLNNLFKISVMGNSCRGIILVSVLDDSKIYLWNPFTRKHRKLPTILNNDKPTTSSFNKPTTSAEVVYRSCSPLGLAYHDNDYKVVQIDQYFCGCSIIYKTFVYSLKLNTWRRIQNFPAWKGFLSSNGVFLNGALHYITDRTPDSIVALHLGTEDYNVLPLPFAPTNIMNLGVLNGCLVLTCCDDHASRWDVWLMKDYGVENSWLKLSEIAGTMTPLTYSKDDKGREQILIQRGPTELHWLDLQTHSMTEVRICGRPNIFSFQTCVESLVRLDSDVRGVKRPRRADDKELQVNGKAVKTIR